MGLEGSLNRKLTARDGFESLLDNNWLPNTFPPPAFRRQNLLERRHKPSPMANTRSALKRVRKTERQTLRNKALKSRVKTYRRRLNAALESGDAKTAQAAFGELTSAADKAGRSRVIHPNSASRLKSIYALRVAALG